MSAPAKLIRWTFYALFFAVPLIFLPNTSELFEFNKIILTYILTTVIAAAWAIDCILQKRLVFKRTLLDWPLLIFLISQFLSLWFSISPHVSWHGYYSRWNGGLVSLIAYSILYWSYVTYMDHKSTLRTLHIAVGTAILISLWGIAEHFGIDAHRWVQDVATRVFSTLGQPNWLAAYLVALIFIPTTQILTTQKPFKLILLYSYTLILFLTLLYTKSRSGLLAFGISSVVFWTIYFFRLGQLEIRSIRNFALVSGLIILLTLVTSNPISEIIFTKTVAPPADKVQGPALEVGGTESANIRKIVWTGAVRIWRSSTKNFFLGTGPETFAFAYYSHRPLEHNSTSEWELLYNKAHNEFLNYLSNTGLLGLLSYLVLLGFMSWVFIKNFRNSNLALALFCGWLSLSVTNFWGFSVVITQIFLFLFPAMASSLNQESSKTTQYKPSRISSIQWLLLFISSSSALFLFYSIIRYFVADVKLASGQYSMRAFSTTQDPQYLIDSYQSLSQAYNLNSSEPAISSDLSLASAFMAVSLPASASAEVSHFTQIALASSQASILGNPRHPNYFKTRSRMFLIFAAADPKYYTSADEALAQAALISPTDPRIPFNRGLIALYAGRPNDADRFFDQTLRLRPAFAPQVQSQLSQFASSSAKIGP